MKLSQKTILISRLALLITFAIVVQIAGLPQPITGPIINALLFTTASLIGCYAGITLGCLTPLVAVIRGQLPPILAPFIPFIAVANAILVIIFVIFNYKIKTKISSFERLKIYFALVFAAISKYLFFIATVKIIFPAIFGYPIPDKFAVLMMTPQLLTALAGGILFLGLSKLLRESGSWR